MGWLMDSSRVRACSHTLSMRSRRLGMRALGQPIRTPAAGAVHRVPSAWQTLPYRETMMNGRTDYRFRPVAVPTFLRVLPGLESQQERHVGWLPHDSPHPRLPRRETRPRTGQPDINRRAVGRFQIIDPAFRPCTSQARATILNTWGVDSISLSSTYASTVHVCICPRSPGPGEITSYCRDILITCSTSAALMTPSGAPRGAMSPCCKS